MLPNKILKQIVLHCTMRAIVGGSLAIFDPLCLPSPQIPNQPLKTFRPYIGILRRLVQYHFGISTCVEHCAREVIKVGLGWGLIVTIIVWGVCISAYFLWASHEQKKKRGEGGH